MDIYSPKGSKVVYLNKNGHGWQREDAITAGLVEGETYTVENIDVDSWVSYVTLEGFPDNAFNTIMFENAGQQYAVLEWQEGNDENASIIATNQSRENAELMVKIAPAHLPREIVTMEELERMEKI